MNTNLDMKQVVPEITDPLGKHWGQPGLEEISFSMINAFMSEESFKKLANYQTSFPTGVYPGKMWKRKAWIGVTSKEVWLLLYYDNGPKNEKGETMCSIKYFYIQIQP